MGSLTAAAQALDLAITDVEGLCDLGGAGDIGKICGLYRGLSDFVVPTSARDRVP